MNGDFCEGVAKIFKI